MAKTIDLQVSKSRTLIQGLRANLGNLTDKGISAANLDEMEAQLALLDEANKECDALRAQLSAKVKRTAEIMAAVKSSFAEKKKVIKGYYTQEEWEKYGVLDKR